jgi:thiopeptide-type bacteriocin biosynthesis protein
MKNLTLNSDDDFKPSGFFVLRTPLLPFDEFLKWSDGVSALEKNGEENLDEAVARDMAKLHRYLEDAVDRPEVREALFIAAPELYARFEEWRENKSRAGAKRMDLTMARYYSRMCGRATPFGLFAGCSVGKIGKNTRLTIAERSRYRRRTRLDMEYLSVLVAKLLEDQSLQRVLRFPPNSSLYKAGGRRWHYVESRWTTSRFRSHHLVAIDSTEYLEAGLRIARHGAQLNELARSLAKIDPEISIAEATDFASELVANQVLVAEIEPLLTGGDATAHLIAQLKTHYETKGIAETLSAVQEQLEAIDRGGLGNAPSSYLQLAESLKELPAKIEIQRLFQVDMFKPTRVATLSEDVVSEIARGVRIFQRLAHPENELRRLLQSFKERFLERYERREVPLVEALDSEIGIGFSATRDDARWGEFESLANAPAAQDISGREGNALLYSKIIAAEDEGRLEIEIEEDDIKALAKEDPLPLPDAFSVLATLSGASTRNSNGDNYRIEIDSIMGPSGALLLGRFCHADRRLLREVKAHLRAEEALRPDAIFAEIVHLPQGRTGNVICRPLLRQYEIPYLGHSGAPQKRQLPITDLMISIVDDKILLRSKRLGCEIIPRLTNAHNFHFARIEVYRFLCALQEQGAAPWMKWNWGVLSDLPFLPRVVSGKVVLSRARWNLNAREIAAFSELKGAKRYRAVQAWRKRRKLPRFVAVADGDNELPIDLDNLLSVETFVELVKWRERVALVELFFKGGPKELCVTSAEGKFLNELIVPFVRKRPVQRRKQMPFVGSDVKFDERIFPPGSAWFYAKIYAGATILDRVLRDLVRPLTAQALASGAITHWFFIRYRDPHPHLRLRLCGTPEKLRREVSPAFDEAVAALLGDGCCWCVQLDTYRREIERYGGLIGTELAERLFHADSEFALAVAETLDGDERENARWLLALRSIDRMFDDFGIELAARCDTLKRLWHKPENVRDEQMLIYQLRDRYRRERQRIERALAPDYEDPIWRGGLQALHERSRRLKPIIERLRECGRAGELERSLEEMIPSYMHMSINRIFKTAQNAQEIVIYVFLERYYESLLHRAAHRYKR